MKAFVRTKDKKKIEEIYKSWVLLLFEKELAFYING